MLLKSRQRAPNSIQLLICLFQLILQPLLLLTIDHQDDAAIHHFYGNLLPGIKPASRSHLPERIILGVDLSKTFGRYPTITERSVPDWSVSGVECESAIINSLIVGEVSSRRVLRIPGESVYESGRQI